MHLCNFWEILVPFFQSICSRVSSDIENIHFSCPLCTGTAQREFRKLKCFDNGTEGGGGTLNCGCIWEVLTSLGQSPICRIGGGKYRDNSSQTNFHYTCTNILNGLIPYTKGTSLNSCILLSCSSTSCALVSSIATIPLYFLWFM